MDHSLPGSSIHGIFQARVLEWAAIASSAGPPSDCQNRVSFQCILDIFIKKPLCICSSSNIVWVAVESSCCCSLSTSSHCRLEFVCRLCFNTQAVSHIALLSSALRLQGVGGGAAGPHYTFVLERYAWGVRLLTTQKPISRPGLVERKVCFISGPGNWCVRAADICPKADSLPPPPRQAGGESFYRQGWWEGYLQKQCSLV